MMQLISKENNKMRNIRACIITDEMYFLNGANRVAEKLIQGQKLFAEFGIYICKVYTKDQIIFCPNYKSQLGLKKETFENKRVIIDKLKESNFYHTSIIQTFLEYRNIKNSKKAIVQYINDDFDFDLIIFNSVNCAYYYLTMVSKERRIPTIFISHVASNPLEQPLINRPEIKGTYVEKKIEYIYKYVVKNVSKTITICQSSYDYILNNYGIISEIITNGVEDISYQVPKEGYSYVNHEKIRFVSVASVTYRKGQDLILEAVLRLTPEERHQIIVNIVGEGNAYKDIKDMIKKYDMSETIIMHGASIDVENILKDNDIFILTSRADTVPVSIIEALRAGMPIIATKVGDIPFMVGDGGMLVDAEIESIKNAIVNFINNREKLQYLSMNSRKQYLAYFTIETMIKNYATVIESLLKEE